jgi:hypothetical protein
VLAHIEVKSKLDKKELLAALDIIKSIKQLNRDLDPYMYSVQPQSTIPCFLFAYSSIGAEKIFEYLNSYY